MLREERLSLDELEQAIGRLPTDLGAVDRKLMLIQGLARPEVMLSILNQVIEDDDALARVAGRSYRHVNHFDKIVLVDADAIRGHRLTLHLWRPPYSEAELNDELIHDHRFSFWSAILTGNLVSQAFGIADEAGLEFRSYRYIPERRASSTRVNFYEFCGYARLKRTEISTMSVGESYYLPRESIHRVLLPQDSMTCTLVLRGPRERPYSNIYNTTYPVTDTESPTQPFEPDELAQKLSALSEEITCPTEQLQRVAGQGAAG
jgi:hypothetical protein